MSGLALLRGTDHAAPFANRHDNAISVAAFLQDVASLADQLPEHDHVVNLCQDRYRFAVGFAAALSRRQITLLPPSEAPAVLEAVLQGYDSAYCLTDRTLAVAAPVLRYPDFYPRNAGPGAVPCFPKDQTAAILFTSGSTGAPQPHARSWGHLVAGAISAGYELGAAGLKQASLIGTVPHQHSYGLESLIMLALQHGLVLQAEQRFYPADLATQLASAPRPRVLVTTPVHLRALLAEAGTLPLVDLVVSATAPLPAALARIAETEFAAPLYEIYGCSEAGQIAFRRTTHTDEWRCLDGILLRQDGSATWADGPGITAATPLADIIELRDSRHFRLLGRTGDLVNIAGKRSSLAYLNAHLNAIDGVLDGVFVMPDEAEQHQPVRLMAFAVAPGMTATQLRTALRRRIDPAFLPRPLHLVDALPRNVLGKLTRETVTGMLARTDSQ